MGQIDFSRIPGASQEDAAEWVRQNTDRDHNYMYPFQSGERAEKALEYLQDEHPEAVNELAIHHVANQLREKLHSRAEAPEWDPDRTTSVEVYDRETLEQAGVIGDEDYEVRGETFFKISDEYLAEMRNTEE